MKRFLPLFALFALCLGSWAQTPDAKKSKEQLVTLEKIYKTSKAAAAKAKPGSPKSRAYVEATVAYGNCVMMSPVLGPKDKYPKALSLFREALKTDPKHKVALENKNMIEQIYKSMNRPIPKG